jgi:hypothetical protein
MILMYFDAKLRIIKGLNKAEMNIATWLQIHCNSVANVAHQDVFVINFLLYPRLLHDACVKIVNKRAVFAHY